MLLSADLEEWTWPDEHAPEPAPAHEAGEVPAGALFHLYQTFGRCRGPADLALLDGAMEKALGRPVEPEDSRARSLFSRLFALDDVLHDPFSSVRGIAIDRNGQPRPKVFEVAGRLPMVLDQDGTPTFEREVFFVELSHALGRPVDLKPADQRHRTSDEEPMPSSAPRARQ